MPTSARPVTEEPVLAVLTGTPLDQAAARHGLDPADLAEAVDTYRAAGQAALDHHNRDWVQVRIAFPEWTGAEETAAVHLGPRLRQAEEAGRIRAWWFLRKHPYWRMRCHPGSPDTTAELRENVSDILDDLVCAGQIVRWRESLYEPEVLAFGGPDGMNIAHALFHADSHHVLTYLRHHHRTTNSAGAVGRKELSVLLCTALLRGARQDEHEQADVWDRVVRMRPLTTEPPPDRLRGMKPALQRLLTLDTTPTSSLYQAGGPLPTAAPWAVAFTGAGRSLADAARDGTLERGLRDVLAKLVIFHWNRLGIPAAAQAVLARAARETLMNPPLREAD
ncbi:thiopeptide-type bacteriocin biosynthesis protein [Streptomyces albipurpureus]|uniref:Thiopeptide-type bacteriocin biosynthesis protein n=1 Tax=Streptomyces albipurpureus TaxID=2897419 RepID=A0ABT0UZA2_9ACTN|nr:thiopeptide-type bacteriocin biosynthesis protein [Streptomyces sp. CWNU-1]MCM2393897.1 thiopeptide-type bacteriocin biosynthesis protein [Streptomyces sp. CWNU-1]